VLRALITIIAVMCLSAIVGTSAPAMAAPKGQDFGRQTLSPNDGWAAFGTNNLGQPGTTGGASADAEHVFVVDTWQEFRDALGGSSARGDKTPRIIYVQGEINANTAPDGTVLTCEDYARGTGYSLEAYLQAYDPATWGRTRRPTGALETARAAAAAQQAAQIRQYVGSNVTIVGVGDDARLVGANIVVDGSDNVIIRNIEFSDTYDCFPQWDPTDGSEGNWNSAYDNLWVRNSTHVWVDHNTFNDGEHPGSSLPSYFGRKFEVHDGLLDITNGADLVTVSYNVFENHDKTMLIGSTNNPNRGDRGKLRVTIHHNLFDNILQRAPRVRFGQVHVYNNCYLQPSAEGYSYSWGVGVESQIYAENNYFELGEGVEAADVIRDWGGTMIHETGTLVNGRSRHHAVSLFAAYNAEHDPDLRGSVNWKPTLYERIGPTQSVCPQVKSHAGAGNLRGR
jgi:pectate lyase